MSMLHKDTELHTSKKSNTMTADACSCWCPTKNNPCFGFRDSGVSASVLVAIKTPVWHVWKWEAGRNPQRTYLDHSTVSTVSTVQSTAAGDSWTWPGTQDYYKTLLHASFYTDYWAGAQTSAQTSARGHSQSDRMKLETPVLLNMDENSFLD